MQENTISDTIVKQMLGEWAIPQDAAFQESSRCLACHNPPCTQGCPAGIPVGDFIRRMKWKDWEGAAELILKANPFGTICGFVCPEDILCEKDCIRKNIDSSIRIRELQKYVTLSHSRQIHYKGAEGNKRGPVAILGGGPAGLSCACILALQGVKIDLYEKRPYPGGVSYFSLPSFRLPDRALEMDVQRILSLNINYIQSDISSLNINDLQKYQAVFIGLGLDKTSDLHIPGENLENVTDSVQFLEGIKKSPGEKVSSQECYSSIIIIGGGNTAMDCALSAKYYYPESRVILSYRRRIEEMPAWEREKESCFKAGVDFLMQTAPVAIQGKEKVEEVVLRRTEPGEPDASGRCRPVEIPGSDFTVPCNLVIKALGQKGPKYISELLPELKTDHNFYISTNEDGKTSINGIWAGGDCCNGGKTVVEAVSDGKKAAKQICQSLKEEK